VITDLSIQSVDMPEVRFDLGCSRGTYVRTLAADIGDRLGCGGHLGDLVRTAVGHFELESSVNLRDVESAGTRAGELGSSMLDSLSFMPELLVTPDEEDSLSNGGAIEVERERLSPRGEFVRLTADGTELVAVGKLVGERRRGDAAEAQGDPLAVTSGAASDTEARRAGRGDEAEVGVYRVRPVRVFVDPV
jgi:tRNA pseudouridine55 synthase